MGWLSQNWIWLAVGIGVIFMMRRGGFGHYAGGHVGQGHGAQPDGGAPSNAPEATIDPVNGEPVRTDKALTTLYRGSIYYFASRENRDRFEAAPQEYAPRFAGRRVDSGGTADQHTRRQGAAANARRRIVTIEGNQC